MQPRFQGPPPPATRGKEGDHDAIYLQKDKKINFSAGMVHHHW